MISVIRIEPSAGLNGRLTCHLFVDAAQFFISIVALGKTPGVVEDNILLH